MELNPKFSSWIKRALKRRNHEEFEFSRKSRELITKRLNDLDTRKEALYGMKIEELYTEDEYRKKKKELLIEEMQLKQAQSVKTTAYWESVIDNTINFATAVTRLFEQGDIYTRQMVLNILGLNLVLKDKKVMIKAKDAFLFLKDLEVDLETKLLWLEPKKDQVIGPSHTIDYPTFSSAEDRT